MIYKAKLVPGVPPMQDVGVTVKLKKLPVAQVATPNLTLPPQLPEVVPPKHDTLAWDSPVEKNTDSVGNVNLFLDQEVISWPLVQDGNLKWGPAPTLRNHYINTIRVAAYKSETDHSLEFPLMGGNYVRWRLVWTPYYATHEHPWGTNPYWLMHSPLQGSDVLSVGFFGVPVPTPPSNTGGVSDEWVEVFADVFESENGPYLATYGPVKIQLTSTVPWWG